MILSDAQILVGIVVAVVGAITGVGSLVVVIYKAIAEAREKRANAVIAAEKEEREEREERERLEQAARTNGTTLKDVESQVTERLLKRLNTEMDRLSSRVESQDEKIAEQDGMMDKMGGEIRSLRRARAKDQLTMVEMYNHVVQVERLVPNPPGPPPRRWSFTPDDLDVATG